MSNGRTLRWCTPDLQPGISERKRSMGSSEKLTPNRKSRRHPQWTFRFQAFTIHPDGTDECPPFEADKRGWFHLLGGSSLQLTQ